MPDCKQFNEIINAEQCRKFATLTFDDFKLNFVDGQNFIKGEPGSLNTKGYFNELRAFCLKMSKTGRNDYLLNYKYAQGEKNGRIYTKSYGIQRMSFACRNYLLDGLEVHDYDIYCCHPSILLYICKAKLKVPEEEYTHLSQYVENRAHILAESNLTKQHFLVAMNTDEDNLKYKGDNEFYISFYNECVKLKEKIIKKFKHKVKNQAKCEEAANPRASLANKILCYFENRILQGVMRAIGLENVCTPMYDGFISKIELDIKRLNEMTQAFGLVWAEKPIVNDIEFQPNQELDGLDGYFEFIEQASDFDLVNKFVDKNEAFLNGLVYTEALSEKADKGMWYYCNQHHVYEAHVDVPFKVFKHFHTSCVKEFNTKRNVFLTQLATDAKKQQKLDRIFTRFNNRIGTIKFMKSFDEYLRKIKLDNSILELLDKNTYILAFKDRCFDFKTKQYRLINNSDYVSNTLPFDCPDAEEDVQTELMDRYFNELFNTPDKLTLLLDILGHGLYTNRYEKFNVLVGNGRNGKTVLMLLLKKALDRHVYNASSDFLTTKVRSGAPNENLYFCKNRKFCLVSEPEEDDNNTLKFNLSIVKTLSGRDTITCRAMYGSLQEFPNSVVPIIAANDIPNITSTGPAMIKRFNCIHFDYNFVDNPTEPHHKQIDTKLKDDINLDDRYCQQFVLMLIEHIKDKVDEEAIFIPKCVEEYTMQYIDDCDNVTGFLAEYTQCDHAYGVKKMDLYKKYKEQHGADSVSKTEFNNKVKEQFGVAKRYKQIWTHPCRKAAVCVVEDDDDEEDELDANIDMDLEDDDYHG
jgi:phage/plasmid-associated DNA primase